MPTVGPRPHRGSVPSPRSGAALAAALALALPAAGCGTLARRAVQARYGADALEARGSRIVGARVVDREAVAAHVRCEREGTPEAACRFDALSVVYDLRGHLMAQFTLRRVADRDGHARHELVVDEGPFFRADVRLDGLEELAEAHGWGEALPLLSGGPFSKIRFVQTKDELLAAARGAGFGEAEVFQRIDRDLPGAGPGTYAVIARYDVYLGRRGEPWRLGAVVVDDDLDRGRKARIERELAGLLHPGEPFDYARFAAARARLRAYPTAEVRLGQVDEARHEIPVLVRVWWSAL